MIMPRAQLPENVQQLLDALHSLLAALPVDPVPNLEALGPARRKRLRADIETAIAKLEPLYSSLDPVRLPSFVFDPSDPANIGKFIADTLLEQPRQPLGGLPGFYGSGVYALYYSGPFDAYQPVVNTDTPLYVGKADPKPGNANTPEGQGTKLSDRLAEHAKSIRNTVNLTVSDFQCRYLVVKSAWQGTAELYLIRRFQPIWNYETGICYGIGKHGDSPATRANTRSPWDTLHPGREWAARTGNIASPWTTEDIKMRIAEHFRRCPSQ
jgi:hypothetical protein